MFWKWIIAICILVALLSGYITMKLIIKGEEIEVPNLVGVSVWQAQSIIDSKKLFLKESERRYDEQIPENHIVSQDPKAGEYIKKGRYVVVKVSKGSQMVAVPELKDQKLRQASLLLQQAGLSIGQIAKVPSQEPSDQIITQNPQAQQVVQRKIQVNLLVSSGPLLESYLMPDLIGKPLGFAKRIALKMGIEKRKITYRKFENAEEGIVMEQQPAPDSKISKGDNMEIVVNSNEAESSNKTRLIPITFDVPKDNIPMKRIKVIITDDNGYQEIFNEVKEGGAHIELSKKVTGETYIEIYVNDVLVEEQRR